jgi:hypothetical protein
VIVPQSDTFVNIPDEHAGQFIQSLHNTLKIMTRTQREEVRLIVKRRQAVAISIDVKNRPFLGYTAGYNQPDTRTALPISDPVLCEIRKWLLIRRKKGPKGGRVFINSNCVYTVPDSERILLFKWKWPNGDIVEEVLSLLEQSLQW